MKEGANLRGASFVISLFKALAPLIPMLLAVGQAEAVTATIANSGILEAPGYFNHSYALSPIDTTAFSQGTITIRVTVGSGGSAASFDLFAAGASIPTTGPSQSLAHAYDLPAGSIATIAYAFTNGQIFQLGAEGNWFSPAGAANAYSYVATVSGTLSPTQSIDSYNSANNQLSIGKVAVGNTTYTNVVITVGSVVSVGTAPAAGNYDTYDGAYLTIPSVLVDGTIYSNLVISIGSVISVGGSTTSSTLSGNVVKGPVVVATVSFYALNADGSKGAQLGTTTTDANGNFKVNLIPAPTVPILAQTSGGTYVDEATGATSTLSATDSLRAVLPAATTIATVTPLTEIAAARAMALAAGGTPMETAVNSSNIAVAQQYNLADIVATLPAPANDATRMSTAALAERQYGLVLAGFAQNASTLGVRPIELAKALATDAKDGVLNGANGGVPINVPLIAGGTLTLPAIAGTTNIQAAINAFIASTGNKSGQSQMPITLTPVQLGVNTAGALYTTSKVLPAAIAGKAYTAGVTATGGTPPYTCALKAGSMLPAGYSLVPNTCQITGSGAILGGGTTMTISSPFTITLMDSATPKGSVDLTLYLTTVPPKPTLEPVEGWCYVNLPCVTQVATANGGTPGYYFTQKSFAVGDAPPLWGIIDLGGHIVGTPTVVGVFSFSICVVDSVGALVCGDTAVRVTPTYTLSITTTGSGGGTVSANPTGPSYVPGMPVLLTALSSSGYTFTGWSGACSGAGTCYLTMDADKTVTATFSRTSSGSYYWANWSCGSSSQCAYLMGGYAGSTGPMCTLSDCNAWGAKYIPAGYSCSTAATHQIGNGTPVNGVCARSGVDF